MNKMKTEYESILKELIPALRVSAAKRLASHYGMTQKKIAGFLGITQAATSKYLNGMYSKNVRRLEGEIDNKEVDAFVKNLIAEDKVGAQKIVCRMCARNLSFRCGLAITGRK
jgi:predicted transcriptional regulator